MAPGAEIAEQLVAYDPEIARMALREIVRELGGDADDDPESYLSHAHVPPDRTSTTTQEWKVEFAHYERLRSLGIELARSLTRAA